MTVAWTALSLLCLFIPIRAGLPPFRIVPQNLTLDFGSTIYQACQPTLKPDFINWYANGVLVGGCLLQSMSITSKSPDPRYKIYMSQQDEKGGISVCYLVVHRAMESDSGVFTCKSSHPDSNIHEVSSRVLVHDKTMRLKVFLQNGTNLQENDSVMAVCSARGTKRPPTLRFMFGGEPVKASLPTKVLEPNGDYNVSVSTVIPLDWRSHLRLLTCHADIGEFRNVQQTFLVVHLST
ncbi:unnamed protein product [Rodentolepis nana]|uniref:Ig-like domain-containing protein n=1 Tax=Rodentolepis nana TaxID=102285 RepID=A0A0R3T6L7_RODNA|nr:unnamed protein product [Rodentolepis nana]